MPTRRRCERCGLNRTFQTDRQRICAVCQREARQRASKARSLRERYGITLEEFEALREAQRRSDGIHCAACGESRAQNYRWSVDHDHRVERAEGVRASIRGLVCRRCNKVLRDVRDSHVILTRLANYVLWARDETQAILASLMRSGVPRTEA